MRNLASCVLLIAAAAMAAGNPAIFESGAPAPHGRIDELVFARLHTLGIQPANLASDAVFVRRVYLDAIGTLPTAAGGRRIPRRTQSPDKRAALIDRLLEREASSPTTGP